MTGEQYDVLVIGAGPAGCAAGIEAARAGARVGVLDRATFPRDKTCGDAVSNRGAALVDALIGAPNALRSIPHAEVRRGAAVFPDESRVVRSFGDRPGYIVPRYHLDDALRRALQRSGATLRQGVNVRGLITKRGRVVGARTDDRAVAADVVIAADGPGSVAWATLGLPYRRGRALAVAITAYHEHVDFTEAPDTSEHYFESDLPCGYGWVFPPVDGVANIGVYQRADHFGAHGHTLPDLLEGFVARHGNRLGRSRRIGRPRSWALPLMIRPLPPAGPGLLVCGDAAWSIDPLSGEGIWQALETGMLAGRTAATAVARNGLRRADITRYRLDCARRLAPQALARLAIQEAMTRIVAHRLYRHRLVQQLLERGYASETLDASKHIG